MQKTTDPIKNKKKKKKKFEELLNQSKRRPLKWVSDTKHHKSTEKHKGKRKNRIRKTHIGLLLGHRVLKGLNRRLGRRVRQRNSVLQSIGEIGDLMGKGKKQRRR